MPQSSPLCQFCKHRSEEDGFACAAFPDEIPEAIIMDGASNEHRDPYPGDRGIRFEPHPGVLKQILTGKASKVIAERVLGGA